MITAAREEVRRRSGIERDSGSPAELQLVQRGAFCLRHIRKKAEAENALLLSHGRDSILVPPLWPLAHCGRKKSDSTFALIAGFTPAGFPYGTTRAEHGIDYMRFLSRPAVTGCCNSLILMLQ